MLICFLCIQLLACQNDQKQWVAGWQAAPALNQARSGFAVADQNGFIYVAGGVDGRHFLAGTEWTRITNGMPAAWQKGPAMRSPRGFFAMIAHHGFLYAVGGGKGENGSQLLNSVERAALRKDGSLGPWQMLPQTLQLPRRCARLLIANDRLFAVGGFAGTSLDNVEAASFKANGDLGPWQIMPEKLLEPRYVHATAQSRRFDMILGGHIQAKGVGSRTVGWHQGGQSAWHKGPDLQTGRFGLSAVATEKFVYALGGMSGVRYFNSVEKSRLGPEGPQNWHTTTTLPQAIAEFGAVVIDENLVIIGGTHASGYSDKVYHARFNQQGDIGFWGKPEQAVATVSQSATTPTTPMAYQGKIVRLIEGGGYIFLQLEADGQRWWVATQGQDFAVGKIAQHGKGIVMKDFYSKSLNRSFEQIIFTGRVQLLD